jgi:hypothetical protein
MPAAAAIADALRVKSRHYNLINKLYLKKERMKALSKN